MHVIQVADVATHVDPSNPLDPKTLREITTAYDSRNRPIARTVWLVARGTVDVNNPPIAGDPGIAAAEGLTTRWQYDENCTDNAGLDATFSAHFAGLGLGANADGSAVLVTNPNGERTLSIADGLGRTLKTVQLGTSGTAAISSQSRTYDTLVTINAFSTSGGANQAGTVLETASTNGTGHTVRSRTDGAGRLIQTVDAENNISASEYDTQGNRTKYRDPTGVGEDCVYNELGWKTQCTDTQGDITKFAYNKAGDITKATDAKNKDTLFTYDARADSAAATPTQHSRMFAKYGYPGDNALSGWFHGL